MNNLTKLAREILPEVDAAWTNYERLQQLNSMEPITPVYTGVIIKTEHESVLPVGKPRKYVEPERYDGFSKFDDISDNMLTVYHYNKTTQTVIIKRNKVSANCILKKKYEYKPLIFKTNETVQYTKLYITCGVKLSNSQRTQLSERGYVNMFDLLMLDREPGNYPSFKEQKDMLFKLLNYKLDEVLVVAKYTRFQTVNSTMQDSVQSIMHMVLQRGCKCSVWLPESKQYRSFEPVCDIRKVALFKTMQGEKPYKNYPVFDKDKLAALQHARKTWLNERYWSVINQDRAFLQFKAINTQDYTPEYVEVTIDADVMECPECGMPYNPVDGCEHCGYQIPSEAEFFEEARKTYIMVDGNTNDPNWRNLVAYYEKCMEFTDSLDHMLGWKA